MARKQTEHGGAKNNLRIIDIRRVFGLSRSEVARLTGYSHTYVDNWLAPVKSANWRETPANAVRLAELELGMRKPAWSRAKIRKYRNAREWPT